VQEKIELFSILQRPRLSSTKISGDISLVTKIMKQQRLPKKFPRVANLWQPVVQGWQLPSHGYQPVRKPVFALVSIPLQAFLL